MSWLIRPREERDIYSPNECPSYTAIGTDANDGMYPLAWAVVEAENSESWNWFLKQVVEDLNIENDSSWTFISDRQKGLINALETIVPNAEHRFCVMHLYKNMWKEHKGIGVRMILWKAARATTEYTFKKHMDELQKLSKKCYDWLSEKPRTQWSRSAFRLTPKSDQIQKRRDKMLNSYALNPICPNAMRRLNKVVELIKGCHVVWSGGAKYLVTMSDGGYQMVVDLEAKRCACRKWEISGIPCYHACACIAWSKKNYEEYIHACYSKDSFLATYNHILDPICGEEEWDATDYPKPLPPVLKVQTGRPKKSRNKTNDATTPGATRLKRQNTKVRCSYCTEYSHNMRTCPARAHDKANGCEKQVKTRTKKAKTAEVGGGKEASNSRTVGEASQGGQETPNQGGQSGERRATRSTTLGEGSQGGVFTNTNTQQGTNNPLGV
ncbi:uncharacterized protein LOC141696302 [Apium graveolens]|uniref:uncharacterized protein LOC141696302 n=1 Tax=Apium graveolens TaxID=4045 RepID=UPI003D79E7F9